MTDLSQNWPAIRAALLAVVITTQLIAAAPLPNPISRAELGTPTAKAELEAWSKRLRDLGIDLAPPELGERVKVVSDAIGHTQNALVAPLRPFYQVTGTGQGWQLFTNPNLAPHRFEVRVKRAGGEFERRYAQLDPEHRWWRAKLRYRRVRASWSTVVGVRPIQRRFSRWLADRIFEAEPDVVAVQTRMLRTRTPLPGKPRRDRVVPRQVLTHERDR